VRLSAYLLSPIIPNLSTEIYQQLGFFIDFNGKTGLDTAKLWEEHAYWGKFAANQNLSKPHPIFSKLELPV
ncbi:MAG: methionine--tRNA ligase, partial [Microcystaceae cyanobacterium]